MTKWKYYIAQFVPTSFGEQSAVDFQQANMNAMGEYGWELVSTQLYHNPEIDQDVIILFYKKPVIG